ncbi:MAG: MerR family DNA-binding transcriptional regulator [Candidatus Eisenbacteria bacterium]|nr:MerR family DNA-binding transcriptional regulator [Candidatus Eisenbacteria bacterium]MBU1948781.1 MerR family DNA-binding transcriptional regulator [Candidatus Eisenbacteria bacterium]
MGLSQVELQQLISIGDLSELTGITPDTIRAWERRYGKPVPIRLPSGHRRYSRKDIPWLRRVAESLARGHRPSKVLCLTKEDLDSLLFPEAMKWQDDPKLKAILEHARHFRTRKIREELAQYRGQNDVKTFLQDVVSPLLAFLGRSWADGVLEIRHEHFLSSLLEDELRTIRASIETNGGPLIVFATLSDENHGLGLQMAAIIAALNKMRVRMVGVNTPISEILGAVREIKADAVALSISVSTGGAETDRMLAELRKDLPPHVRIGVGGAGARGPRRGPRGIDYFNDFKSFETWLHSLENL